MKNSLKSLCLVLTVFMFQSCSPPIELSSSWSNKNAQTKASPKIMVLAFGKSLSGRQLAENQLKEQFTKRGYNVVASLDILKPDIQKYDSITFVNILRENKVDLLLTNAVVNITEKERYVEGSTYTTPVASVAYPAYYHGMYNYYGYRSVGYQTVYETRTDPGYTVIDVEVQIESNLYDVSTTELLWVGQSKSYTKEPSVELANEFARLVIDDLVKNNLVHQ